jgi:two-component system sensor histidine kinase YesM
MHDIVIEQEEKRKSELDALQSQINPHFLYNTLDSVVWMIEGERYDDAVFMITELASLFRISLSRGKTIISIEDEVKHAENYMNIQKVRFKNKFQFEFLIDEDILHCCTVKLVLQPLLENAIYYGVEYMDGDGVITVRGYRVEKSGDRIGEGIIPEKSGDRIGEEIIPEKSGEHVASEVGVHKSASKGDIILEVEDNGLGIMSGKPHARSHGSGVGLRNVHNRIALRFGADYGIWIDSVPDEGTRVCIRLPYIEYSEKAAEALERQGGRR